MANSMSKFCLIFVKLATQNPGAQDLGTMVLWPKDQRLHLPSTVGTTSILPDFGAVKGHTCR